MRLYLSRSFVITALFAVLLAFCNIGVASAQVAGPPCCNWGGVAGPQCCNSKRQDETISALPPTGREIFETAFIPVVIAITVLILAIGFWIIFQRPKRTRRLISIPLSPERPPSESEPFPYVPIVVAVNTPTTQVEELELL